LNDILKVNVVGLANRTHAYPAARLVQEPVTDAAQMQKLKYRTVGLRPIS